MRAADRDRGLLGCAQANVQRTPAECLNSPASEGALMSVKKILLSGFLAAATVVASASTAAAVPILQLYVEGGTYDQSSETWVVTATDTVRLWAIGNVAGEGGKGTIVDVRLAISYAAGATPVFTIDGATTGGFGGFVDPSTADDPTYIQTRTDGSTPIMGDGQPLPSHGSFGPDVWWQEYLLGDFTLTDSPIADFIDAFPTAPATTGGQISVYEIQTAGFTGTLHFDLYDHYYARHKIKAVFAPFSHDAELNPIPEPGTMALVGSVLVASVARRYRARKRQSTLIG